MLWLPALPALVLLAACKPAEPSQSARDIVLIQGEPKYCKKIGVVEGAGGNDGSAKASALEQAAERGATHARLEAAHPDLEDGMTLVVTGVVYRCPTADEVFPPVGYP